MTVPGDGHEYQEYWSSEHFRAHIDTHLGIFGAASFIRPFDNQAIHGSLLPEEKTYGRIVDTHQTKK
jgi:hypothetical protein